MGLVFDVQKFSLHDGRGIRTLVFLKGCPLRCHWCANPESQSPATELLYGRDRCIGRTECTGCLDACPRDAVRFAGDGRARIDREACNACGACAAACPARALETVGAERSVDDLLHEVERDGCFFARSGGGLTISGGEPLRQARFVRALLEGARSRGLATALETSGACSFAAIEAVCPLVDELFYDIKCIDPELHRRVTGVSNAPILRNFARLRRRFPRTTVVVRTPVVPGINDSVESITAIADFVLASGGAAAYELLPYHRAGRGKYDRLGRPHALDGVTPPSEERMRRLERIAHRVQRAADTVPAETRTTAGTAC